MRIACSTLVVAVLTAAVGVAACCCRGRGAAECERCQGVDQGVEGEQLGKQVAAGTKGRSEVLSMCFARLMCLRLLGIYRYIARFLLTLLAMVSISTGFLFQQFGGCSESKS